MLTSLMASSQGLERLALEMETWRNLLSSRLRSFPRDKEPTKCP
uniref:Uncharacterized protein n=1 Tax=virus sp. ct1Uu26 TaxID=2826789 RepID=A0A8S5R951_9VIRU|nr:MAG TPA: hypothetical protein [virus sp. ct1Uu26]